MARVLARIEKLQIDRTNILWQQRFSYLLFFQDDIYAIACNHFSKESGPKRIDDSSTNNRFSFITRRRLISKIRQQDLLETLALSKKKYFSKGEDNKNQSFDYCINSYFESIREVLTLVLQIVLSVQLKPLLKEINECNNFRSIHSIFPFMEDHFSHRHCLSDIKIPHSIHPEILIRIFRRRIQDAPFLHSLRLVFYEYPNIIVLDKSIPLSLKEINKLSTFLWNYYVHEFESTSISIWKRTLRFKPLSYGALLDRTQSIHKIEHIQELSHVTKSSWILILSGNILPYIKKSSIHYVRYGSNLIIALKGTKFLVHKWKSYIIRFWQYYFHCWFRPYRIRIKKSSKDCLPFLGYTLGIRPRIIVVQTKMINDLPLTSLITKELCAIIPVSHLIQLLAKEKFCDASGRPIGKLAWTTFKDDDIPNQFNHIWKNIFYYYSGCLNRNGLYQIQYILRFSCAKTLACKHKSTIRVVWKKYGSRLFPRSSFYKKRELIPLFISKVYFQKKRFWYLDIIQIDFIANLLRKGKRPGFRTNITNEKLIKQLPEQTQDDSVKEPKYDEK
uniref:Maturase K n=4 Tax=Dendrolycopodium obscurum TaxID=62333 RepID=A0A3Q9R2R7_DENOS|nr:maturase K [Dendrolycopodium obscurum]AZU95303.1 maturase K [Dendrolycopodium obscurum]